MKNAKIAIVHEWWANFGGAENVVSEMSEVFPDADIWVLYKDKEIESELQLRGKLKESWLKFIPFHENRIVSVFFSPLVFRTLTLKKYDIVISSSHTFAHTVKLPLSRKVLYLSYVYTPSRSLWLPSLDSRGHFLRFGALSYLLKTFDKREAKRPQSVAVISTAVLDRVQRFWNRSSILIYPPVRISHKVSKTMTSDYSLPQGEYLLSAGRLVPYKRHDFAIRLAAKMNIPLVIMGSGTELRHLQALAFSSGAEVYFVIGPDNDTWVEIMRSAIGLIFAGVEDFGITPIEAISVGTPVFALAEGGALDYIKSGVNGELIASLDLNQFSLAIKNFQGDKIKMEASIAQFSQENFRNQFRDWVFEQFEIFEKGKRK